MTTKRRRFGSVLALAVAVALAVAACGGGTDGGGSDGGTLNVGINVEPTEFSPSRVQTILFPFTRQIYDSLIEYDDKLHPEPRLATGWQINADHSAVTVTLRDDVTFHTGRKMTAADVAANLAYFADPKTGQQLSGPMSVVDSWQAVNDTTLEVKFTHPLADMQITDLMQSWTIGAPEEFGQAGKNPVGTGPFSFVEWLPGERVVLKRNDNYWGPPPAYGEIDYRVFDDMDSLVSGFESGVVDVVVNAPPLDAQRLKGENTVLEGYPGALVDQWRINPTKAPFDNPDVRRAINYATDREAILSALYQGYAEPAALPFSKESPAYDEGLAASLGYDLDRAKQLLVDSGLPPDQLRASIMVNSSLPAQQQAAQILQASLAKIGFTLEIQLQDNAESTENMLAGNFQITYGAIGNAQKYPTRITTNSNYRTQDNPLKATEAFPDYAPAVADANAAVTPQQQAQAFAHLNQVLNDAMWSPTVGYQPTLWLISPDVSGVARNVDNMLLLGATAPAN
jgi:peptide/nickel transport system substrate-binding protein